jgi:adenylyl-sulfate kinase
MDSRQAIGNGQGIHAGSGPGGIFRVAVCGNAAGVSRVSAELARLAGAEPSLVLDVVSIAGDDGGTAALLDALPSAALAIVVADGADHVTNAERGTCLRAWRLTGAAPILAVAGNGDGAAKEWHRLAHDLGIPVADRLVVDIARDASSLIETVTWLAAARRERLAQSAPLRFWVTDTEAGAAAPSTALEGELVGGRIAVGQEIIVLPSASPATVAAIASLPARDGDVGPRLAVTLDQPVPPAPGRVLSDAASRPELADQVVGHIVWLGRKPMLPGRSYVARLGTQVTRAQIGTLKHRVHPATLEPMAARRLVQGDVGLCNVSFAEPLVFDPADRNDPLARPTSRFALEDADDGGLVGRGEIAFTLRRATNIHWQAQAVDKVSRSALKGQRPACLWFTGLSGSGKSTIASALEKRLNAMGLHTYTLDGDNVRHGLSRDLGFTDTDRVENIRRIAEVAKLFVDAGLLVMVSFISPFRAERRMARGLLGADEFLEIFVDTPIEVCEQRDPKGLYRKARAGQLKNFTGIDSPYEPPEHAEIRIAGGEAPPEALVERILVDLKRRGLV